MALKSDGPTEIDGHRPDVATNAYAFDSSLLDHDNPKVRQLIEAAGRLFMEMPYEAVSTDAIAREAQVSKATLYAHFSSKENLFATLVGARCSKIASDVWDSSSGLGNVEDVLRQFGRQFVDMLERPDTMPLYRSVVAQSTRFPELGKLFYETGPKRFEALLADFLTEATRRGLLKVEDPPLGALQFIQLMAGDIPTRGLLGIDASGPEVAQSRIDSGIALFLAGYRPV